MKRLPRAALETAFLFGLLGFLYSAAWAAFRPSGMAAAVTAIVPLRRDTFGALCFAVSALCAFAAQVGTGSVLPRRPRGTGIADAALRTVVAYGLLVWAYLCVNSLTHPDTTGLRLTHFTSSPAEGTAAVFCYVASAAAFLTLRWRGLGPQGGG